MSHLLISRSTCFTWPNGTPISAAAIAYSNPGDNRYPGGAFDVVADVMPVYS